MKQIRADRYGNDSRKRGCWSVCVGGSGGAGGWVSVFQTEREGNITEMQEQRSSQSFFFCLFFLPLAPLNPALLPPPSLTSLSPTPLPTHNPPPPHPSILPPSTFFLFLLHPPSSPVLRSAPSWVLIALLEQRYRWGAGDGVGGVRNGKKDEKKNFWTIYQPFYFPSPFDIAIWQLPPPRTASQTSVNWGSL